MVPLLIFGVFAVIISAGVECVPSSIYTCDPSPCGPNSVCRLTYDNIASCSCLPNYIGVPPNCRGSEDQHAGHNVDQSRSCNLKKCQQNSECYRDAYGHAACRCKPGYMITSPVIGLCFQCGSKFDCDSNNICNDQSECADPCPGDCGLNDDCYVYNHKASCRPKGSQSKCSSDNDCSSHEACDGYKCVNPCLDLCDNERADCQVENHKPNCTCKPGFYGSPYRFCSPNGYLE